MIKRYVTMMAVCAGMLIPMITSAQNDNPVFGKVDTTTLDMRFIDLLQMLNPEFGFTPDKAAFTTRMLKNYILVKAKADIAKSMPVYQSPETKRHIAEIRQMAEDKYLSTLYDKSKKDDVIQVSDAEARNYYDTHILQFTLPGRYSFFTATVRDTTKTPVKEVVTQMKAYATIVKDEFKSGDNSTYVITYDKGRYLAATDVMYPLLSKLNKGEYATTSAAASKDGPGLTIYMLAGKTSEEVTPYDQVKEQCRGNVTNIKRQQAEQDFINSAQKKHPLVLDSPLFK